VPAFPIQCIGTRTARKAAATKARVQQGSAPTTERDCLAKIASETPFLRQGKPALQGAGREEGKREVADGAEARVRGKCLRRGRRPARNRRGKQCMRRGVLLLLADLNNLSRFDGTKGEEADGEIQSCPPSRSSHDRDANGAKGGRYKGNGGTHSSRRIFIQGVRQRAPLPLRARQSRLLG